MTKISRSTPEDADILTHIAFTSKGHWGYPEHWMEQWRDALTITPEFVRDNEVYVANLDGEPAGYYALTDRGKTLEHLWVTPSRIGSGIGRGLFEHAVARAASLGAREVEIEADPNAEGFYLRMGARRVGGRTYEIDGRQRVLPLLVIEIPASISSGF